MHSSFASVAVTGGIVDGLERPMCGETGQVFDPHERILTLDLIAKKS